jgi:DNA repair ATPase RecN
MEHNFFATIDKTYDLKQRIELTYYVKTFKGYSVCKKSNNSYLINGHVETVNEDENSIFIYSYSEAESFLNDIYNTMKTENNQLRKSLKRKDYFDEINRTYGWIKKQIISTAKHMIEQEEDIISFEHKLKEIARLKKNLFEIECDGVRDARILNGRLNAQEREVHNVMTSALTNLDKFFKDFSDSNTI